MTDSGRVPITASGDALYNPERTYSNVEPIKKLDSKWVSSTFMISEEELEEDDDHVYRFWNSAKGKFTDSSIGGNVAINCRNQFTPYADVREKGRRAGRTKMSIHGDVSEMGMGSFYSEAEDDNIQVVYLQAGVPKHASLLRFFSLTIDPQTAYLAATGKTSIAYLLGTAIGTYAALKVFPVLTIAHFLTGIGNKLIGRPSSKFYTLKPQMHLYWSAVNGIATDMAINLGIIKSFFSNHGADSNTTKGDGKGQEFQIDTETLAEMREIFPDVFKNDGYIDIYAIATRAHRMTINELKEDHDASTGGGDFGGYIKGLYNKTVNIDPGEGIQPLVENMLNNKSDNSSEDENTEELGGVSSVEKEEDMVDEDIDGLKIFKFAQDYLNTFKTSFKSSAEQGASFAMFKVDHTGTTQESFSNSATESGISSTLKGITGGARSMTFNLAQGNIVDVPVLGDILGGLAKVATSALGAISLNVSNALVALAGGGYIDVPKRWEDSTVELPTITYTAQLRPVYNNPLSQYFDIYIPLAMLLPFVLPLATGKTSYGSPLLVSCFDRGKQYVRTGLMTNMSVQRGTSNLAYTRDGRPLGVDVSFTITDLSSIMAMPVSTGNILTGSNTIDEDHLFNTYMSVITSRSLYSQYYAMERARINLTKEYFKIRQNFSPSSMGIRLGEPVGRMLGIFYPGSILLE